MLSVGEDVEAHALRKRGWSVSAIARHLGRDRKTVRRYLAGTATPGARRRGTPDALAPFGAYVAARFVDDPHLWASALFDEVSALGYERSYVSFARQLVNGHQNFPTGGHEYSPRTATRSPRGRPREVPRDGHRNSPGTATLWVGFTRREASPPCLRWRRPGARTLLR
ncbi:MAG: helix-turn-helix domain-containing protein [Acidimicrobiales bacterium]